MPLHRSLDVPRRRTESTSYAGTGGTTIRGEARRRYGEVAVLVVGRLDPGTIHRQQFEARRFCRGATTRGRTAWQFIQDLVGRLGSRSTAR